MAKTANVNVRIDPVLKADLEAIYGQYGMSITDAINVFLYQSRNIGGLPFDLRPEKSDIDKQTAIEKIRAARGIIPDTGQTKANVRAERRARYENTY